MIQRPSPVACSPFGCGPGDLNAISTLPQLRTGTPPSDGREWRRAGDPEERTTADHRILRSIEAREEPTVASGMAATVTSGNFWVRLCASRRKDTHMAQLSMTVNGKVRKGEVEPRL